MGIDRRDYNSAITQADLSTAECHILAKDLQALSLVFDIE